MMKKLILIVSLIIIAASCNSKSLPGNDTGKDLKAFDICSETEVFEAEIKDSGEIPASDSIKDSLDGIPADAASDVSDAETADSDSPDGIQDPDFSDLEAEDVSLDLFGEDIDSFEPDYQMEDAETDIIFPDLEITEINQDYVITDSGIEIEIFEAESIETESFDASENDFSAEAEISDGGMNDAVIFDIDLIQDIVQVNCKTDNDCVILNKVLGICFKVFCDSLSQECKAFELPEGTPCDLASKCLENEVCTKGECVGTKVECDDENPCTTDFCSDAEGCIYTENSIPCNDGNECTLSDFCIGGQCKSFGEMICSDDDPCTDDICDKDSGCEFKAKSEGADCDDKNKCTGEDRCTGGKCTGLSINCDDDNPCTSDACFPESGCVNVDNNDPCDDKNACTVNDRCDAGICVSGEEKICDDGNECTVDLGDSANGCGFSAVQTEKECDDNDLCTEGDKCKAGICAGEKIDCTDGLICTDDLCHASVGCYYTANTADCDDGDDCTPVDKCKDMICEGSGKLNCDDSNICTDDYCGKDGKCGHASNSEPCDDGSLCTLNDICIEGVCTPGSSLVCDDGIDCTENECDKSFGCFFTVKPAFCLIASSCYAEGTVNTGNFCEKCDTNLTPFAWSKLSEGTSCGTNKECNEYGICVGVSSNLTYRFNETGTRAFSTDSNTSTLIMRNTYGTIADLHSSSGQGVSGLLCDRAFDNTASSDMGSSGIGGRSEQEDMDSIDSFKSFTLAGWFKTDGTTYITNNARFFHNTTGDDDGFELYGTVGGMNLTVNGKVVNSGTIYADTQTWVFFAVTYDGTSSADNVKWYKGMINSPVFLEKTVTWDKGTIISENSGLAVGNKKSAFDRPFDGYLDNMRIRGSQTDSSGVLTQFQIEAIRFNDVNPQNPSADAALLQYYPSQNHGSDTEMQTYPWASASATRRGILRFDISHIPEGTGINSATLTMCETGTYGLTRTIALHRVTQEWSENSVTWYDRDSGKIWTNPGGDFASTPSATASVSYGGGLDCDSWDVKSDVQAFVSGTLPNYGWIIRDFSEDSSQNWWAFATKENATVAMRPKLVITYTPKVSFVSAASSGAESATEAGIEVSLSASPTQTVTVDYAVTGGTAEGGGSDYALANGKLTFSPCETTKYITFTVIDDSKTETDETVEVTLSNPTNAVLGDIKIHTYKIIDNDAPKILYVNDKKGDDSTAEIGNPLKPWKTIQGAVNSVPAALDTSYVIEIVNSSTYNETVTISGKNTTETKTLTVMPSAGQTPLIAGQTTYSAAVSIISQNHVMLRNLKMQGGDRRNAVRIIGGSSYNVIEGCDAFGTTNQGYAAIGVQNSGNNIITRCRIHNSQNGIEIWDYNSNSNVVTNNIIYNNVYRGVWILQTSSDNQIINNTFFNNAYGIHLGHGGDNNDPGENNVFLNNNIYAGIADSFGIKVNRYYMPGYVPPGTYMDYNNIYAPGSGAFAGHIDGINYKTLSDWQAGSEQDENSISQNPFFVNSEAYVFDVKSKEAGYLVDSPVIEKGLKSGLVAEDFYGKMRPQGSACDIGAFEHKATSFSPDVPVKFAVSGISDPFVSGNYSSVTVKAINDAGNAAEGYTGTVKFSSSDSFAVLPPDYTFLLSDKGVKTFSGAVSLVSAGTQSVTVTDNTDLSIKGTQNFITVSTGVLKKFTVKKDGSGDFTSISDAVNALPKTLESPYLIEVQDNYSYGENVLIAAKITNAVKTLVVRPAPSKHPLVEPFVQYAGGFDIFLTNYVTIAGFRIRGENMEFGIHIRNSSYCTIRDNYLTDADVMDGAGILLSHGGNNEIFNNVSYGNLSGIVLYDEGSDNNIIKNNIIYNNSENGIRLYRNTDNNKIYNNTFYNNNVGIFLGHGGKYYDPGINNWFYNNIIFTGIENGYGIKVNRYLAPGGLPAGTIFNYGDIFAALASVKTGHIDGTDYVSLSDWQAAAAQDGNSISSDPLFVDAEHNDFQLKCIADGYSSDSPAIDAGKTLPEVTDDFLYIPRPQGAACDIGAYE